jgi:hypothetical protein
MKYNFKVKPRTIYIATFLILIFIIFFLIYIILKLTSKNTKRKSQNVAILSDSNLEYQNTGKCISCEKQFNQNTRWMGESNKCYDCEKDMIARSGGDPSAAYNATKVKCFDC